MLGGLAEGDTVVLAGQARLMRADGVAVRVVELNGPDASRDAGRAGGQPAIGASAPGAASAPGGAASIVQPSVARAA